MHTDISHPVRRTSRCELLGLTTRFGDVLAVQGVSFITEPGTITGFLGPNRAP